MQDLEKNLKEAIAKNGGKADGREWLGAARDLLNFVVASVK